MAKSFEDFYAAFPALYRNVRCGFECPPGWEKLLWELSEKLEPLGVHCVWPGWLGEHQCGGKWRDIVDGSARYFWPHLCRFGPYAWHNIKRRDRLHHYAQCIEP